MEEYLITINRNTETLLPADERVSLEVNAKTIKYHFIYFPVSSQLEHRVPFGVSVITSII
jgi:hypothetical protein